MRSRVFGKKILLYCVNGIGMGHLRRLKSIIDSIGNGYFKEIILVTSAIKTGLFGKFFNKEYRLIPLVDMNVLSSLRLKAAMRANIKKFTSILRKEKPDVIISDINPVSEFSINPLIEATKGMPIKNILIWRLGDKRNVSDFFKKYSSNSGFSFERIIVPHTKEEIKFIVALGDYRKIIEDKKFYISGPIVQQLNTKEIQAEKILKKIKIKPKDFLITVTVGGGGSSRFRNCESPKKIIKAVLGVVNWLNQKNTNFQCVVILGPYLNMKISGKYDNVKILRQCNDLTSLMVISNIIISSAGYNTVNEIIYLKKPAVLIPLIRGGEEQYMRCNYLYNKGRISILKHVDSDSLFYEIQKIIKNYAQVLQRCRKFELPATGNLLVGKLIREII